MTLDSILNQEPFLGAPESSIDFLKIDVEGFEDIVLSGGSLLLSKFKPKKIKSEIWREMKNTTWQQYLQRFKDAGYAIDDQGYVEKYPCDVGAPFINTQAIQSKLSSQPLMDVHMCLQKPKSSMFLSKKDL
eukprot:gnl/MRDRNA2_/MRDRNA2_80073_c0_seq1.p1 gnl/MRDRNA2_/MRDRNA2_80073_c0~~gnl/MRDRNA2_/MRDRNA2_80073_c0_seq1.p1  ORF type:complete len:131 (+),score=29.20 gnl/MRDRNA2_/MRDRNA2_80073_c0_seq1:553-945(+)